MSHAPVVQASERKCPSSGPGSGCGHRPPSGNLRPLSIKNSSHCGGKSYCANFEYRQTRRYSATIDGLTTTWIVASRITASRIRADELCRLIPAETTTLVSSTTNLIAYPGALLWAVAPCELP